MMPIRISVVFIFLLAAGCASPPQRDAAGHPPLERLATAPPPSSYPLRLEEIVAMERAGHEAPVIIQKMRRTTTRLSMSMAQQQQARELGASAALIQALIRAEDEAHEADRLTAEADRAAEERDRREQALAYWNSYDPYYGPYWPHSYFGYGAGHHHHGWGVGVGSGWGW